MFETSVVHEPVARPRSRLTLFVVSIIAHSAVITGAIALSIASVAFPIGAPDEFAQAPLLMPVQIPPPLGNPNGGAPPRPAAAAAAQPAPRPGSVTAPDLIPDTATPASASGAGDPSLSSEGTGQVPGPIGVPWGVDGGAGDVDAPPVTETVPVTPVYELTGEVKAPVLLHRVEPPYPQSMIRTRMPATVVVRCIIGRDGQVRDPRIVVGALPPFNDAVIRAVQQWRYTPGSLRGQAVDTYLTVTVNFAVR